MNTKKTVNSFHPRRSSSRNRSFTSNQCMELLGLEDEVWHNEPFFVPLGHERASKPLKPTAFN